MQDQARKTLLHTIAKWPQANTTHLWPYALAHAANVANHLPTGPDGNPPLELSSGTEVRPTLKHFHTFGSPVLPLIQGFKMENLSLSGTQDVELVYTWEIAQDMLQSFLWSCT